MRFFVPAHRIDENRLEKADNLQRDLQADRNQVVVQNHKGEDAERKVGYAGICRTVDKYSTYVYSINR